MGRRRDRLAPLLRVARAKERLERAEVLSASRTLEQAEMDHAAARAEQDRVDGTLRAGMAERGVDGSEVAAWNAFARMAGERTGRAMEDELGARSDFEGAQDRYRDRVTERRVVEALDERRRLAWSEWRRRNEQTEADEMAAQRKART